MATDPRDARLRRLYDISAEEYDKLLAYQGGGCALCGRRPVRVRLAVDHDHKTGRVRGLLCMNCNRAIREWMTAEWLYAAWEYIDFAAFNVTEVLGRQPQGVIGRITNKRRRKARA